MHLISIQNKNTSLLQVELEDIIKDKLRSKCRFLTFHQGKLLITDLGLDHIYSVDPISKSVTVCGVPGVGPGCLSDPAGLVVDSKGNWLVADSKNHRFACRYCHVTKLQPSHFRIVAMTGTGEWKGEVSLKPMPRRPSGLAWDGELNHLYVLNLQGPHAVTKFTL